MNKIKGNSQLVFICPYLPAIMPLPSLVASGFFNRNARSFQKIVKIGGELQNNY